MLPGAPQEGGEIGINMVAQIFDFALRQRVFVLLGVFALVVAGVWSAFRLPIDAVPDITNVQVQINTSVAALAATSLTTSTMNSGITPLCPHSWGASADG